MNNKALTLSIAMALLAVFFVQSYVSSVEEEAKKKFGTEVLVVKAKRDLKEMETITEKDVELKRVPKRFLEPNAVYSAKGEEDKESTDMIKQLSGTVAVVPIKKGEQILFNKITEPNMRTGLAPQIAPGRRAIAIQVSDVSGVSKLVKPGDRVDVIAVVDLGGGKENKLAKTILQDVVVLSVGRYVTNNIARTVEADGYTGKERVKSLTEDPNFSTVTLEVEPMQAQSMALLVASGDNALTLSLRNNDDQERVQTGSTNFNDVLGADSARVVRTPAAGGQPVLRR